MQKGSIEAALALLLLCACANNQIIYEPGPPPPPPPSADGAGNWNFPDTIEPTGPGEIERRCVPDQQLCVSLRLARGWTLTVEQDGRAARTVAAWPAPGQGTSFGFHTMVREASGAWLIGVERGRHADRAWGWYSFDDLLLFRVAPDEAEARLVLEIPLSGFRSVRLCPITRRRRPLGPGCWRDHTLGSAFHLDLDNRAGPPRFLLESHAEVYPGPTSPPRQPGVWPTFTRETDQLCSYRRAFTFDPASRRYVADAPLPACDDYLKAGD